MFRNVLQYGPWPFACLAMGILIAVLLFVKKPKAVKEYLLFVTFAMGPVVVGMYGYMKGRSLCKADWEAFLATNPTLESIENAKEFLQAGYDTAKIPLYFGLWVSVAVGILIAFYFAVHWIAKNYFERKVDKHKSLATAPTRSKSCNGLAPDLLPEVRAFLSAGSYIKLVAIIAVGYALANEFIIVARIVWKLNSEGISENQMDFLFIHLLVTSPIHAFVSTAIAGLLGFPLFRIVTAKRGGLLLRGEFTARGKG